MKLGLLTVVADTSKCGSCRCTGDADISRAQHDRYGKRWEERRVREAAAALVLLLQCCNAADTNALRYILRTAILFQVLAESLPYNGTSEA